MNLNILKKNIRTSKEQFEMDFGFGYQSAISEIFKFRIKKLTKKTFLILSYFFIVDFIRDKHDQDAVNKVISENEVVRSFVETVELMDKKYRYENSNHYYLLLRNSFLISAATYSLFKNLLISVRAEDTEISTLGFYIPSKRYSNCIFIAESDRYESVVSHEHIHFMQYLEKNKKPNFMNLNLEVIFDDEDSEDAYLRYLTKRQEVEARFHEVVIANYKKFKKIPMEINEFMVLLNRLPNNCFEFSNLILKINFSKYQEDNERLDIRDIKSAEDLDLIVNCCKDFDVSYKFMVEVLPVIYANLLSYYGLEKESANFHDQIKRPNLYDKIYGFISD